jgi:single-stranded DNA-specific DHH superfamily exonuclease
LADTAPEQSAERLQSLIDLYHHPEQPQSVSVFLDAATRHLPRIERQIKELAEEKVPLLEKRLQEAIEAVPQNPQKAREICRAIVVLYQDKPWAKDVVLRAQETLDKLDRAAGS